MSARRDVVVIGGGHNGLVAGAYLAKSGLDVLVCERRPVVGGAAVSEHPFGPDYTVTSLSYVVSLLPPDLVTDLVGRLLASMQDKGATLVVPTLRPQDKNMQLRPWSDPENFNPGYVMRSQHILFKQGDREPWIHLLEHEQEREILPEADLDDGTLVYR